MNRDQQEQSLWREAYWACRGTTAAYCAHYADAAVAEFRKRYPAEPAAPEAVWYDDPPRPGEYHVVGLPHVCWVAFGRAYWLEWDTATKRPIMQWSDLDGRRVYPIIKPQEPPQ